MMPRFDLRADPNSFDPLAAFKMLAVLCEPADVRGREALIGTALSETDLGIPRRHPLSGEEFLMQIRLRSPGGVVAGGLLLTQLQLHANGYPSSLNTAMRLVASNLPKWIQPTGQFWSQGSQSDQHPRSRKNMLAAYNRFRLVAHLWAALVHAGQHSWDDLFRGDLTMLPRFVACAECFLDLACRMPSPAASHRFVWERSWAFTILGNLEEAKEMEALPLTEPQLRILNKHKVRKLLR